MSNDGGGVELGIAVVVLLIWLVGVSASLFAIVHFVAKFW